MCVYNVYAELYHVYVEKRLFVSSPTSFAYINNTMLIVVLSTREMHVTSANAPTTSDDQTDTPIRINPARQWSAWVGTFISVCALQ